MIAAVVWFATDRLTPLERGWITILVPSWIFGTVVIALVAYGLARRFWHSR